MQHYPCTHCGADNLSNARYCCQCGQQLNHDTTATPPGTADMAPAATKAGHKKSRLRATIFSMLGFAAGYIIVQQLFFHKPLYDKEMIHAASEINKNCPVMVDAITRLDNASSTGNTFQYNYTLINMDRATTDTAGMKKILIPQITNFIKTDPSLRYMREHHITIKYYYKDKTGNYLCSISVAPEQYE